MKIYAILNNSKICTGISMLSGEVLKENMIEVPTFSEEFLWKKYENGVWSAEKFEPQSTAPLTEFEKLQEENAILQLALAESIEKQEKDKLENQLAMAELIETLTMKGVM